MSSPTRTGASATDATRTMPAQLPSTGLAPGGPRVIGPYRLLERLGEGGMGEVYLAEQTQPVRRRVALKLIKPGMDTRQLLTRFEAERQTLALMNHPNIAAVLDAGATEQGRPYFVMEYVPGEPITTYCDRNCLSLNDRLTLFIDVCHAVQHAHQKAIIHRDLKPSNVLILEQDGKPIPKIIDFGVSKAIGQRLTEDTLQTQQGAVIGTPAYMSPEQSETGSLDVDTRSDIYSLGVVLYELLTGTLPFDPKTLRRLDYAALRRMIHEVEPPRPSTRLGDLRSHRGEVRADAAEGHSLSTAPTVAARTIRGQAAQFDPSSSVLIQVAECRRCDARSLIRAIRGDLDWIVMKCLEKDRTRRYETANELALEIQRYLSHEPILAGPPGAAYRLRKFVRRNRGAVIAGGIVAAALVAASAVSIGFAASEARQRRIAEQAREAEASQRRLAETRQRETDQVAEFQAGMIAGIDPDAMGHGLVRYLRDQIVAGQQRERSLEPTKTRGKLARRHRSRLKSFDRAADAANTIDAARGVVDEYVLRPAIDAAENEFEGQPLVQARILEAIGQSYHKLGMFVGSEQQFRRCVELYRAALPDDDPRIAHEMLNLSESLLEQANAAAAKPILEAVIERLRAAPGDQRFDLSLALNNLGVVHHIQGNYTGAERALRDALAMRKAIDAGPAKLAETIANLGIVLRAVGRTDEAGFCYRESLRLRRQAFGNEHKEVVNGLNNLAVYLRDIGDLPGTAAACEEALEIAGRVLGEDHPMVGQLSVNLGMTYADLARYADADRAYERGLDNLRRNLGTQNAMMAATLSNMADVKRLRGDLAGAEAGMTEAYALTERLFGADHPRTALAANNLANVYLEQGRFAKGEALLREALHVTQAALGEDHQQSMLILRNLGAALWQQRRFKEAELMLRKTVEVYRSKLGDDHLSLAMARESLGTCLLDLGEFDEAEAQYAEVIRIRRTRLGEQHPELANAIANLANLRRKSGRDDEACRLFEEALQIFDAHAPPHYLTAAITRVNCAAVLIKMGEFSKAEKLLDKVDAIRTATEDPSVLFARGSLEAYVELYTAWHVSEPDRGYDRKAAAWRGKLDEWRATTRPASAGARGGEFP